LSGLYGLYGLYGPFGLFGSSGLGVDSIIESESLVALVSLALQFVEFDRPLS